MSKANKSKNQVKLEKVAAELEAAAVASTKVQPGETKSKKQLKAERKQAEAAAAHAAAHPPKASVEEKALQLKKAGLSAARQAGEEFAEAQKALKVEEEAKAKKAETLRLARVQLAERVAKFPAKFMVKDQAVVCMVSMSKSKVDPETGEESYALVDGKGELVAEMSLDQLKEAIVDKLEGKLEKGTKKGSKKADKAEKPAKKGTKKPSKKGARREGNIPMMKRMLVAGNSDAEILTAFSERYTAQEVEHKAAEVWIAGRVAIYKKIAMQDAEVAAAVTNRSKPKKAAKKGSKKA